jgi:hypothetical protein
MIRVAMNGGGGGSDGPFMRLVASAETQVGFSSATIDRLKGAAKLPHLRAQTGLPLIDGSCFAAWLRSRVAMSSGEWYNRHGNGRSPADCNTPPLMLFEAAQDRIKLSTISATDGFNNLRTINDSSVLRPSGGVSQSLRQRNIFVENQLLITLTSTLI